MVDVEALLPPPQLARFRALAGLGADEPLELVTGGWHKLVLLTTDRAFLFPRHAAHVGGLERELVAYGVLAEGGVPLVPAVLGTWHDEDVHPYPFAAVTRLPGVHLEDPVELFPQLGVAIATWHSLAAPSALGDATPPADHDRPHQRWLHRVLDPQTTGDAVDEAVAALDAADRRHEWHEHLAAAAQLAPVLVHGDVHEDQLLADDGGTTLTGVLDWETARIDHPFFDFDFGEWGTGLWRDHRAELSDLWRRQWEPYADARGLDLPVEPLVTAFGIRQRLLEAV